MRKGNALDHRRSPATVSSGATEDSLSGITGGTGAYANVYGQGTLHKIIDVPRDTGDLVEARALLEELR